MSTTPKPTPTSRSRGSRSGFIARHYAGRVAAPSTRQRTVAVVLAGGVGSRVGMPVPKQLLKIAGKPIIEHTLGVLQQAPEIDDVLVMMTPDFIGDVERIVSGGGYTKVSAVLP